MWIESWEKIFAHWLLDINIKLYKDFRWWVIANSNQVRHLPFRTDMPGLRVLFLGCWPVALSDRYCLNTLEGHKAQAEYVHFTLYLVVVQARGTVALPGGQSNSAALFRPDCAVYLHIRKYDAQDLTTGRQVHWQEIAKAYLSVFYISLCVIVCTCLGIAFWYCPHQNTGTSKLKKMNTE